MPETNDNTKNNEALKFEALASLIIEGNRNAELRHNDLRSEMYRRFDKLDEHNAYQNGSIGTAIQEIADLKKESNDRKLTCGAAVEELKRRTRYTGMVKWVNEHQKKFLVLFSISFLGTIWVFTYIVENQLVKQFWDVLKQIG